MNRGNTLWPSAIQHLQHHCNAKVSESILCLLKLLRLDALLYRVSICSLIGCLSTGPLLKTMGKKRRRLSFCGIRELVYVAGLCWLLARRHWRRDLPCCTALPVSKLNFWRRNFLLCSRFKRLPLLTFPPKGQTFWVPALIGELLLIDGSSECWSIGAINRTFAREK